MTYNGLFQIPDGNADKPARTTGQEVRRAVAPAVRVGTGRIERERRTVVFGGGLDPQDEFSTASGIPRLDPSDPLVGVPDTRGGRLKLAVMLAIAAVLIVSAVAGVIAFAAPR